MGDTRPDQPRPSSSQQPSRSGDGDLAAAGHDAAGLAAETARETASGAAEAAAGRTERAGEALRQAAESISADPALSSAMTMAADRLESLSRSLRDQDLGSLYRRTEGFARREPALFLAGAALAGFALSRLAAPGAATPSDRSGQASAAPQQAHHRDDDTTTQVHAPADIERPSGPPAEPLGAPRPPAPPRQVH